MSRRDETRRRGERGQILPLWGAATVTTFTLMFLLINYGNTVRYQIRAQNAADAAAQALMAVQTQRFNELTAALYTSNVEEFRTRLLLDGMLQTLNGAAGCGGQPATGRDFATGTGTCPQTYNQLLFPYIQSVNRYTADVSRVNDIATQATYTNWSHDMSNMLTHLSSANVCNTIGSTAATVHADGGDCAFQYSLNGSGVRTGLNAVSSDAYIVFVPTQGFTLSNNAENENAQLFDPGMVDVVVCTKVQPLIPVFAALNAKPHYVIGRAGATAVLVENDWLQPGALQDQARSPATLFQPPEVYSTTDQPTSSTLPYDWYGVLFGGNSWVIAGFPDPKIAGKTDYGYESYPVINDMSAYAGWWNAIPYDPRKVDTAPVNVAQECPP
jgi:hypothetical protein